MSNRWISHFICVFSKQMLRAAGTGRRRKHSMNPLCYSSFCLFYLHLAIPQYAQLCRQEKYIISWVRWQSISFSLRNLSRCAMKSKPSRSIRRPEFAVYRLRMNARVDGIDVSETRRSFERSFSDWMCAEMCEKSYIAHSHIQFKSIHKKWLQADRENTIQYTGNMP